MTLSYLYVCHLFVWGFSQNYISSHFVGIFMSKNVFKIMKHHQINYKLSFINLEYYLVFQLQFVKKWLVYLKNSSCETTQLKTSIE